MSRLISSGTATSTRLLDGLRARAASRDEDWHIFAIVWGISPNNPVFWPELNVWQVSSPILDLASAPGARTW